MKMQKASGWAIVDFNGFPVANSVGYTKRATIKAWVERGRWDWRKWSRKGFTCQRVDVVPKAKVTQ